MQDRELLIELVQEFKLLRQAVERIERNLTAPPAKPVPKPRIAGLPEAECKTLYREIVAEYKQDRTTRKLDALLARPKPDLSLFCAANNLPVDLHNSKASIRDQILARIREDEQLSATYRMPTQEPAYLAERKK